MGEECEVLSIGVPTRWGIWIVGSGVRMPAGRLSTKPRSATVTEKSIEIMLTDDELLVIQPLESRSVVLRNNQHALNALARPLLTEHHL